MATSAPASTLEVRRLDARRATPQLQALADVLVDCVEGGASVSFMLPMTRDKALAFWRKVADGVARGERVLLVAEDAQGIVGTVQVILDQPENQPHRADVAKMLVHRRARRQGAGAALMRAAEARGARAPARRCWCSTPPTTPPPASTRAWAGRPPARSRATRCCRRRRVRDDVLLSLAGPLSRRLAPRGATRGSCDCAQDDGWRVILRAVAGCHARRKLARLGALGEPGVDAP